MDKAETIQNLLDTMDASEGFAGMGAAIQTVTQLIDDDGHSNDIIAIILRDPALTARIMQIANFSRKNKGGGSISTLDQFLSVYGLTKIKTIALSLALIKSDSPKRQQDYLHAELVAAFFCGSLASKVTRMNGNGVNPQETQVCGLMQNLGRMMGMFYLFNEFEQARHLQIEANITEKDAITKILGASFDDIGAAIAEHWSLPPVLSETIDSAPITETPNTYVTNPMEWHKVCAFFCRKITDVVFRTPENVYATMTQKYLASFKKALNLDERITFDWIEKCLVETDEMLKAMNFQCDVEEARALLRKATERAVDILQETDSLLQKTNDDMAPIDIAKNVMRKIHAHCNFDCTLICIPVSSGIIAISGIGRDAGTFTTKFRSAGMQQDIFKMIMDRKVDALISDVHNPAYAKLIPNWYYDHADSASFVMLPLFKDHKLSGFIYGDYTKKPESMPTGLDEGEMLAWRNTIGTALNTTQAAFQHKILTGVMSAG